MSFHYTTGGLTIGIDYRVTDHIVVGLMGGYAHTWTDSKPGGSIDVDTAWGGLYAGCFNQGLYVLGGAFGGGNSFDTSRTVVLDNLLKEVLIARSTAPFCQPVTTFNVVT
jgi:uncharacterized protein with beta-barrel porin domain